MIQTDAPKMQPLSKSVYTTLPDVGFVRIHTVLHHIPVGRSTWWAGVRSGKFPRPIKIGGCTVWRVEDIRALIEALNETARCADQDGGNG